MKNGALALFFCILSLTRVFAEEQTTQQKKTVAKRDEVFYNNVGSVKNSYSIEEEDRSSRSAEKEENQNNFPRFHG